MIRQRFHHVLFFAPRRHADFAVVLGDREVEHVAVKSLAVEPQRRDVGKPRGRGEDEAVVDHFAGDIGPRIDTAGALHFAAHELRRSGGMRAERRAPTDVDTATAVGLEREVVVEVKVHAELVSAENRPMAG